MSTGCRKDQRRAGIRPEPDATTDVIRDGQSAARGEAGQWREAARIRREHPGWGRFRAYPLFRAPRGTALTAATPDELAAQMDRIRQARSPRARSPGVSAAAR